MYLKFSQNLSIPAVLFCTLNSNFAKQIFTWYCLFGLSGTTCTTIHPVFCTSVHICVHVHVLHDQVLATVVFLLLCVHCQREQEQLQDQIGDLRLWIWGPVFQLATAGLHKLWETRPLWAQEWWVTRTRTDKRSLAPPIRSPDSLTLIPMFVLSWCCFSPTPCSAHFTFFVLRNFVISSQIRVCDTQTRPWEKAISSHFFGRALWPQGAHVVTLWCVCVCLYVQLSMDPLAPPET